MADTMALVADNVKNKKHYVDAGWPELPPGEHAVSELVSNRAGSLSPFGDTEFPLPVDEVPYVHPVTVINK